MYASPKSVRVCLASAICGDGIIMIGGHKAHCHQLGQTLKRICYHLKNFCQWLLRTLLYLQLLCSQWQKIPIQWNRWVAPSSDDHRSPMMTSSNGNIFRATCILWGEFTGHRLILLAKSHDAELWRFLWSAPEQAVEQSRRRWSETPSRSLWRHCNALPRSELMPWEHTHNCFNTRNTIAWEIIYCCFLSNNSLIITAPHYIRFRHAALSRYRSHICNPMPWHLWTCHNVPKPGRYRPDATSIGLIPVGSGTLCDIHLVIIVSSTGQRMSMAYHCL